MIASKFLAVFADIPARRLDSATRGFCVLLLLGLAFKSVLLAHWALSAILVVLAGIILINMVALNLEREAFVPLSILVAVLTATVILTTFYVGLSGATWMFPTLVGLRFAAPPSQYQPARLVLIVMVPLVVLYHGDAGNAGRLLAAGIITSAYLWLGGDHHLCLSLACGGRDRLVARKARRGRRPRSSYAGLFARANGTGQKPDRRQFARGDCGGAAQWAYGFAHARRGRARG